MRRGRWAVIALSCAVLTLVGCLVGLAGVAGKLTAQGDESASSLAIADIPAEYLAAYRAAADHFELGATGWAYLAGIGKIETDHGSLSATGVLSGQNAHGCCAGPMQIHNGFGAGTATWAQYRVDGDADGRTDIYDVDDAVWTAARLERASGAPRDWRRAIFAYNHAGWYVDRVVEQAQRYLAEGAAGSGAAGTREVRSDGRWLVALPGFPGERCDARIVRDVRWLVATFGLFVSDCFGGHPHAIAGEHPLGLAVDVSPVDGNWGRTQRLAARFGWTPSCARAGCGGRGPFRLILYNGYPSHGDPRHSSRPHLHLSWEHAPAPPFTAAQWVRVLSLAPGGRR